jgi:hypothetical protein
MASMLDLPFQFIRVPNLKLRTPRFVAIPSASVVFVLVFLSYFVFFSGVIYDVITETPSIGSSRDPNTGAIRPVAIMPGRLNSQYIIEGLSAGFLYCLGGLGLIILDKANHKDISDTNRFLMLLAGGLFILISYNLCIVFIRIKVPGYMR